MKTNKNHVAGHKVSTQPGVTTDKKFEKRKAAAFAKLKAKLGLTDAEGDIIQNGDIEDIARMLVNHNVKAESKPTVEKAALRELKFTPKEEGDCKDSSFIHALEQIQEYTQNGKYVTIEHCMTNSYLTDCCSDDQMQLLEIANWYLNLYQEKVLIKH